MSRWREPMPATLTERRFSDPDRIAATGVAVYYYTE